MAFCWRQSPEGPVHPPPPTQSAGGRDVARVFGKDDFAAEDRPSSHQRHLRVSSSVGQAEGKRRVLPQVELSPLTNDSRLPPSTGRNEGLDTGWRSRHFKLA